MIRDHKLPLWRKRYESKTSFHTYDFVILQISPSFSTVLLERLPVESDRRNVGTLEFIESNRMCLLLVFAAAIVLAQLK